MESAEEVIRRLGLAPLPREGGFFAETWRSEARIQGAGGERSLATTILYLLTPESRSAMHRLKGDEVWHFHLGDPVQMVLLHPDGSGECVNLGPDLARGMRVQRAVPAGTWQGARLRPGGRWALLGTTAAPGFDPADFEPGDADALAARWPELAGRILALATRP